ncbi:SusE domain-containing protein [Olivibacter domesticus]|nr:SusE domain-containing protein [Olivibacter domesticus]
MISVISITLFSCKKDEQKVVITAKNIPVLVSSNTTVSLTKDEAEEEAVNFSWDTLDYKWSDPSVSTDILTYTIQIGRSGDDFRSGMITKTTKSKSLALSVQELNKAFLDLGFLPHDTSKVDIRLNAGLAPNAPLYSNVITLTASPYELASYLYVPGAYQGWDPVTALRLQSAMSNGIYIGEINFPEADSEFKITPAPTWDISYGDAGSGKISLDASGNFKSPGAGNYRITVNTNDNTIEFELLAN